MHRGEKLKFIEHSWYNRRHVRRMHLYAPDGVFGSRAYAKQMSINLTSTQPAGTTTPIAYSLHAGLRVLQQHTETHRQQRGQFLTPAAIAEFMACQFDSLRDGARILDPAAGSGTLACAMIEQAVQDKRCTELFVDCVEIDPLLCAVARATLEFAGTFAARHGVQVHTRIIQGDFILNYCNAYQPDLFRQHHTNNSALAPTYDYIIANPPYFKLNRADPRARATAKLVHGNTNIYTLFLAIAAHLLADQGQAGFLVPRSFCSGAYFGKFRRSFLQQAIPLAVHTFESRVSAFKADEVLQENVIFAFRKRLPDEQHAPQGNDSSVTISSSQGSSDLARTRQRTVALPTFATSRAGETCFRIPLTDFDEEIIRIVDTWSGSLASYGLSISTGPVVAFRAEEFLTDAPAVDRGVAVPLLWMQNIQRQQIEWPTDRRKKPQGLLLTDRSRMLLVPVRNYVILRRFSAKEDARRLVAAPLLATQFPQAWIGLENHLNYMYSTSRELEDAEINGLAALFNSAFLDRYVRMTNGTTQVNAAELRALPLPPLTVIREIGQMLLTRKATGAPVDPDAVVFEVLRKTDAAFAELSWSGWQDCPRM
jgi:adenine-specific DNA-methyltransferase